MNLLSASYSQSDPLGKVIFLLLFAISVVSWALLIYKTIQIKRAKKDYAHFLKYMPNLETSALCVEIKKEGACPYKNVYAHIRERAMSLLRKNAQFFPQNDTSPSLNNQKSLIKTQAAKTAFLSKEDVEHITDYAFMHIDEEVLRLDKNLFILAMIYALAPFMGLLGTVWGILLAFMNMQASSGSMRDAMLSGLATALTTTVLGLIIAIPALIAHSFLKNGVRTCARDMESFATKLIGFVEMQYRPVHT